MLRKHKWWIKLILKAIQILELNILDCGSSNAPICSSSAIIVMHAKFLKQSDKSICTNLSSLMDSRGSKDKCLTIAEFSQHPSHHRCKLHTLNLHVALLVRRYTLLEAKIRFILALAISLLWVEISIWIFSILLN